ncbi:MAG: S8 family peptidase [Elusimicrobiota bacterium]
MAPQTTLPAAAVNFDQGVKVEGLVAKMEQASKSSPAEQIQGEKVAVQELDDSIERRIVVFKKSTSLTRRMSLVRDTGGIPTKDLWLVNAVAVIVPKVKAAGVDRSLASLSEVLRVEKDYVQNWLKATTTEEAPPDAAGQKVPWGIKRVNAKAAWPVTRGKGVKVAVIDTGIDFDHEDLVVAGGYNAIDNSVSYKDDNGHGTHCAGTIAGQDNGIGVVGVAPDVTLYGVKVLSASGSGTFEGVIDGIQWAVKNNMDIGSMSLGASSGTESLAEAIANAKKQGTTIVAAAGNSGRAVGYPAAYPEAIAVAASDSSDQVAYFSSRGPEVDIIAPGVSVESTYMGGGYRSLSGTSMACPHAAGLAALAIANGASGFDAVMEALQSAATKFDGVPDTQQGAGMVDAGKLVQ